MPDVPRVTTILSTIFPITIDPARLVLAQQRGTAVHRACELLDGGGDGSGLDVESLDPSWKPYVAAYQRFLTDTGFRVTDIETPVRSVRYGYTGTPDRVGLLDGKPVLLDLKTGVPWPTVALQTAAYAEAWKEQSRERTLRRRAALYLRADATYGLTFCEDREDFKRFTACLVLYRWLAKEGKDGDRRTVDKR